MTYEKSTTYEAEVSYELDQDTDSSVMGLYLVPTLRTHELEWHHPDGTTSDKRDILTYPVTIDSVIVLKRTFDPYEGPKWKDPYSGEEIIPVGISPPYLEIPYHKTEEDMQRLDTYSLEHYTDDWNINPKHVDDFTDTWNNASPAGHEWKVIYETASSVGVYVGVMEKKIIGAGVEGEF
jgi:hypothetical protein